MEGSRGHTVSPVIADLFLIQCSLHLHSNSMIKIEGKDGFTTQNVLYNLLSEKKIFASKLAIYSIYQVDTVVSILYGRRALSKFPWVIVCQKTKD